MIIQILHHMHDHDLSDVQREGVQSATSLQIPLLSAALIVLIGGVGGRLESFQGMVCLSVTVVCDLP